MKISQIKNQYDRLKRSEAESLYKKKSEDCTKQSGVIGKTRLDRYRRESEGKGGGIRTACSFCKSAGILFWFGSRVQLGPFSGMDGAGIYSTINHSTVLHSTSYGGTYSTACPVPSKAEVLGFLILVKFEGCITYRYLSLSYFASPPLSLN